MSSVQPVLLRDRHPEDLEIYERLAKLQEIYAQVSELRTLLPDRLTHSTRTALVNANRMPPEEIAASLKNAVMTGSLDIKRFKSDLQSEDMRNLWQKVNSAELSQGQEIWATDYTTYIDGLKTNQDNREARLPTEESRSIDDNKDFADLVKKFEEQNPDVSLKVLGGGLEMALEVTMPDAAFSIAKDASQPKAAYMVSLRDEGSTPRRAKDVLGHIVAAHMQADLESLLGLLASYKNLKTTLCNNCGKVFDDDLNFALVRKRKEGSVAEKNVSWVPLHANCAS